MRHGCVRRSLLAALGLLVLAVPGLAQTDLLISEYVEGTSFNKALELYNPTAAAIDLTLGSYSVQIFSNGSPTASATISLQGVIAPGATFVLAHGSAVLGVTPNQTSGSVNFNGNDAVTLRKGTTVIDSLGQVGFDPGTEWGSGLASTADNTLRRKPSACSGDTNPSDAFTPSTQWDGFATDTFSGLGSHTASCGSGAGGTCDLFFSEYVEGSSNNKVLEIYNPGPSAVSLSGYSVELYFNGSATVGTTIALTPAATLASGDVWVLAHSSASNSIQEDQASGSLSFNGDDAVVLKRNGTVIDSIGQVGVDPGTQWGSGVASTADNTLRRKATVCSGDSATNDAFAPSTQWDGFASDTFSGLGSHTANCTCSGGGPTVLEIWQIQGSGTASPYAGQSVTTHGNIVTAVGPDGFFLQTPDARVDADPATSNGIFVFTGSAPGMAAGDVVDVTGNVAEFFDFTEFSGGLTVTKTGTAAVPAPVNLNPPGTCGAAGHLERYEGMRVRVANGTVASPTDRFGDAALVATATRPFREPGIACPGLTGLPVWDGNPEVFEIDPDRLGLANLDLAGGAVIVEAVGGLGYAFGDYQIWPTTLNVSGVAAPGPVRAEAAGEFTVGAQNLLRLYDTVDDPGTSDDVPTNTQYRDRLNKFSLHIRTVLRAPEILAVSEAENLTVLQDLADEIETDDPSIVYIPYLLEGNDVGGIDVGFLVRGSFTVSNVSQWGQNDTYTFNGQTLTLNDRPPLVLEGTYTGCGTPFPLTVIAVHQRSLSGIDGTDGPRVREKRHQQALRLSQLIQSLQAANPSLRLVVAGDFNAFEFTDGYVDVMGQVTGNPDPLSALIPATDEVDPDLTNQTLNTPVADRYSFVFDGTAQTLDHVLTSQPLDPYVTGFEHSRGNSDAPASFGTVSTSPLRSSDHDGAVLFLSCTANGG
ncbi:MAG TPA: lamin tail domain-containing protein [Thermoanaerobaculia bacterium]|nr:lamin tail domain-containing protein [Thermoanaerobaculia bacterium]